MNNILINNFEGPLDLLLHLIKQSKMDIYEINIMDITHHYLNYIEKMENLNLDIASEYLVMAAELIEMKSRYLLPKKEEESDEYEENPEEELKKRLLEYQIYKDSTKKFKELESSRHEVYTKSPERITNLSEKKISNESDVSVFDLFEALQRVIDRVEYSKPINTKITKKELSVSEYSVRIRNILKEKKKVLFIELFDNFTREYIVVTFLSILEMAKGNEIKLTQENTFGEIYLERVD